MNTKTTWILITVHDLSILYNKSTLKAYEKLQACILSPYILNSLVDSFDIQAFYDEALPAFDVLGKKSFFLGEVGNGAKMKLVVNMVMGRYFSSLFFPSILNLVVGRWITCNFNLEHCMNQKTRKMSCLDKQLN